MKIRKTSINASSSSGVERYYDVYTDMKDIDAELFQYDIDADEFIAEQQELLDEYGMEFVGIGVAKEEYYDMLADNGEEFVTVAKDDKGQLQYGIFIHDDFCPVSISRFDDMYYDEDDYEEEDY